MELIPIRARLHWTDKPYKWHANDGEEVFVVLDGAIDLQSKEPVTLEAPRLGDA